MVVKSVISDEIAAYAARYQELLKTETTWRTPCLAFAAADDPLFDKLKTWVRPTHAAPRDLMASARTVITYFIPFSESIALSNQRQGMVSRQWAVGYVETNQLIVDLNDYIATVLRKAGFDACALPPTHNYDKESLMSDWSHRHVAFVAGLGTFGRHNLLITEKGCCGRLGSLLTDAVIDPTGRPSNEFCLHRLGVACGACVEHCSFGALQSKGFDRARCYAVLQKNAKRFSSLGVADACGKCLSVVPCSFENPAKKGISREDCFL